jgi:hypothetical protein
MTTTVSPLAQKIAAAQQNRGRGAAARPARTTRKPSGKPPWPMVLLAGAEKAGKSYSAALASASEHLNSTYWIGIGEDDPDEYGAIPGARFEIVEHDGTYWDIAQAIDWAAAQPAGDDGRPNMIVLDSGSRLWNMLGDEAQILANERRKNTNPDAEAPISMDLWNRATSRWEGIMSLLRSHNGPVVITARLETVTVMDDDGKPTKERQSKVKGQKGLPFDVGVVVQMPSRGEAFISGARSLKMNVAVEERKPIKGFSLPKLWEDMGVTGQGATAPRKYSAADGAKSAEARGTDWLAEFNQAKGSVDKLEALRLKAKEAGLPDDFGLFPAIDAEVAHLATAAPASEAK